jgi:hypothetical protein
MPITTEIDASTNDELTCPVPGCDYSHPSANGIISHVGNGHPDGWDETDATARDVHKQATHRDESDMKRVATVEDYLARNGVRLAAVDVFVHQGYGTVQIATTDYIDDWDGFRDAVEVDGIRYNGDVNVCTDEFVDDLPEPMTDGGVDTEALHAAESGRCRVPECGRWRTVGLVCDASRSLCRRVCRYHRKEFLEVTS